MELLTDLVRWTVTTTSGDEISIWADGYSTQDDDLVFGVLVRATVQEQARLPITGRTPSDPERVVIELARLSRAMVTSTISS